MIKLTPNSTKEAPAVWLNEKHITYILRDFDDTSTIVQMINDTFDSAVFRVQEAPEEIISLIEESERKSTLNFLSGLECHKETCK